MDSDDEKEKRPKKSRKAKGEGAAGSGDEAEPKKKRRGKLRKNNEQANGEGEGDEPMATFSDDEEVEKPKKRPSKKRVVRDDDEEETAGGPRKKQLYVSPLFINSVRLLMLRSLIVRARRCSRILTTRRWMCHDAAYIYFCCLLISVSFNFLFSLLILLFGTAALRLLT